MLPNFIRLSEIQPKSTTVNKHVRGTLDRVREEYRISIPQLTRQLPELVGRTVRDIGQLSNGELRHVTLLIKMGKVK